MMPETAARLLALNRDFYHTFGRPFAATRRRLQPGVRHLLPRIQAADSVLDLGCGNGELARVLARNGFCGRYLGLDFSRPLLDEAGPLPENFAFREADLTASDWAADLQAQSWSLVVAFAVLHHIPSAAWRLRFLRNVHALLVPGGQFFHSEWQFLLSEKWRQRIQPWSEVGLDEAAVEPGDYLLDWRSGGRGLRYVHHFSREELETLATATGFVVRETFSSDGENGQLGLYQVWEKAGLVNSPAA